MASTRSSAAECASRSVTSKATLHHRLRMGTNGLTCVGQFRIVLWTMHRDGKAFLRKGHRSGQTDAPA